MALACYARQRQKLQRTRVLVISPHPDDDVIGCGGVVVRLARSGAHVSVLYVTDGSASHVRSQRFPPAVLRDLRESEARDALRTLGVTTRPCFLRAPDGRLAKIEADARSKLITRIARAVRRLRPHVLFTPWHRDPHPDHIATATLVEAARALSRRWPLTYFYGVWLPVRGSAADAPAPDEAGVRDIVLTVAEIESKHAAIMQHRSQTSNLVDDDPEGFRIDAALLAEWLKPIERFYMAIEREPGTSK